MLGNQLLGLCLTKAHRWNSYARAALRASGVSRVEAKAADLRSGRHLLVKA